MSFFEESEKGRKSENQKGRKSEGEKIRRGENQKMSAEKITRHTELKVYQRSFDAAMAIFRLSKNFPKEETYSLTDQVRRSSRSISANISEGWRKRRYPKSFVSKLNDAEGEAGETQTWIQFAVECEYIDKETARNLYQKYDEIIAMLISMQNNPEKWTFSRK